MWGFTDGEGCERFWSELQQLIPGLHVTSYHWHLFILDTQVGYVSIQKLLYLGKWLCTHTVKAQEKEEEALKKVENQPLEQLLGYFVEQ